MKKIITLLFFFIIVCVSLFLPAIGLALPVRLLVMTLTWAIGIYLYFVNQELFVPALFFLIHTILCPLSLSLVDRFSLYIPQIYFLPSIVAYLLIVLHVKRFRERITWLHWGRFDKVAVLLIVFMTILTAVSLSIWAVFIKKDMSEFQRFVPRMPLIMLSIYGFVFPVLNSLFEEFMARAVLFDGFLIIFKKAAAVIAGQAVVFSVWHFHGFPGGVTGVIMVFIWSVYLGIIRHRAQGMLPPIVAHFFADLSIAVIILFLVIMPG